MRSGTSNTRKRKTAARLYLQKKRGKGMKKLLTLILVISMLAAMSACGGAPEEEVNLTDVSVTDTEEKKDALSSDKKEDKREDKKEEPKEEKSESAEKPMEPAEKPADKPEEKPVEKPAQTASTVGLALLADFKAKAGGASSVLSLAESLVNHEIIANNFMGGASSVNPGLLAGFGSAEITGFKSGACFEPMMGTTPFVGYVFELEDGTDVSAFIANLRAHADVNWHVCNAPAEEVITGSVGNKVFFVMCPKHFAA